MARAFLKINSTCLLIKQIDTKRSFFAYLMTQLLEIIQQVIKQHLVMSYKNKKGGNLSCPLSLLHLYSYSYNYLCDGQSLSRFKIRSSFACSSELKCSPLLSSAVITALRLLRWRKTTVPNISRPNAPKPIGPSHKK